MKFIVALCRLLVGCLFIFSGLIKANDPLGFSYKLDEYFEIFHMTFLHGFTVYMAMGICILEVFLGIVTLVGDRMKSATWMLVGLMITSGEIVWLFTIFLAITLAMMTDTQFNFVYLLVTAIGGIAAARGVCSCTKRNDIYFAGVRTGLVNAAVLTAVTFLQPSGDQGILTMLMWNIPLEYSTSAW